MQYVLYITAGRTAWYVHLSDNIENGRDQTQGRFTEWFFFIYQKMPKLTYCITVPRCVVHIISEIYEHPTIPNKLLPHYSLIQHINAKHCSDMDKLSLALKVSQDFTFFEYSWIY